ncbi:S-adenosyl-L-methionine-dependent methyltransferase [Ilyonectria robusta]|uniref:S-adenosyl-L-methionine-dependent methyltransferase n=1 Tax=Ilyonectria robusta TaxID=1079257 RepID=UPI001E8DDFB5|nr:S-adenosyl-L-methionine-dependent methyltransferase [Ilyonectria robusta]KAH8729919.1 S-adenosyl-L-methionine-dependent methyltransferase [Ilyonectria robusta]
MGGPRPEDELIGGDDHESVLESEAASSTDSLTSSIMDYRRENGRTYHRYKDGKYKLPNDDKENDRLDLQHHLFLLSFNDKLGLAPPNNSHIHPKRVLDLGTGTGLWAIDFGDEHPEVHVVGVDLSPIQPSFVPPNVEFFVDDIEETWTYSNKFDYIHSRMMTSSIASWPDYLRQMFENLAPGGYVELQEIDIVCKSDDGTLTDDHALAKTIKLCCEAALKFGREYQEFKNLKGLMAEIGFVDIVETHLKWPSNTWPKDKRLKEIGSWNNENMTSGLEAFTMAPLTRGHGMTPEEVNLLLVDVRRDLNNPAIHAYWPVYSLYGKRPEVQLSG